ncbi:MAG: MerR family DNA-binding transcriptional regulator [Proteobacteria bacterium]|nr:MerR family DNA-binding transcriptional regulator [Pseudomonadota bacterium]
MRIGELAAACDCSAETIRYYEKIGLLPSPIRQDNGYRCYESSHRKWLTFILRSKALGFSQLEVRRLTDLATAPSSACQDVHELILEHIRGVRVRLRELKQLEKSLLRLEAKCIDETLHDCPVIDELMN